MLRQAGLLPVQTLFFALYLLQSRTLLAILVLHALQRILFLLELLPGGFPVGAGHGRVGHRLVVRILGLVDLLLLLVLPGLGVERLLSDLVVDVVPGDQHVRGGVGGGSRHHGRLRVPVHPVQWVPGRSLDVFDCVHSDFPDHARRCGEGRGR